MNVRAPGSEVRQRGESGGDMKRPHNLPKRASCVHPNNCLLAYGFEKLRHAQKRGTHPRLAYSRFVLCMIENLEKHNIIKRLK